MINKKALLVLASAVVFAACGNQDANNTNDTATNDRAVEETTKETTNDDAVKKVDSDDAATTDTANVDPIPATGKTLEEAIDAFYTHFGDDTIELESAELDHEDGKYHYNVQGFKDGEEYEASFDADSLDLIAESKEADDDTDNLALDTTNIITAKEAMEKALEGQDGAYVKEYELSIENGVAVYEVDVENGNDVAIDAATGEIVEK